MTLVCGINDSRDYLEHFRRKVAAFEVDDLNKELALECANAGWSLCDWIFKEIGTATGFPRFVDFQEHVRATCPELAYLQDLAISYKHNTITKYAPKLRVAKRHNGSFSSAFSRNFDVSGLNLEVNDGTVIWMENAL